MKKIGVYIHIPFCKSKCNYCDFNSFAGQEHLQKDYLLALIKEIKNNKEIAKDYIVDTVFIGGGTPSCMFLGAISTIIIELKKVFKFVEDPEITIEANPNTISMSNAMEWINVGINRVSLGLQTTNSNILKLIGRTHNKKDYINAINILKQVGFKNINTDLMIGLPKQKSSDVKYAVNLCAKLGCTHISCYSLILEEGTALYNLVNSNTLKLPKEEKVIGMYNTANKYLSYLGYNKYEVSNYSLKGYECKHNYNCWSMQEYIGFGAGAHSFVKNVRYGNVCDIRHYIDKMEQGDAIEFKEKCTNTDLYEESIMLGLRKLDGVALTTLDKYLNKSFVIEYRDVIDKYKQNQMIELTDDKIKVTEKGMQVLNQIILDFVI